MHMQCILGLSPLPPIRRPGDEATSSLASLDWGLVACWLGLSKRMALCAIRSMCLYGHPCLCTRHCNSDQSWAFWTCSRAHSLCPPDNDTDYMRKMIVWKIFFVVYSITIEIQISTIHAVMTFPLICPLLSILHKPAIWAAFSRAATRGCIFE